MSSTIRFVLAAALLVVVVALGGAAAIVWPFLQALGFEPLEALRAVLR